MATQRAITKINEMQAFLSDNFFTTDELARMTDTTQTRIEAYVHSGCLPRPSLQARTSLLVPDPTGQRREAGDTLETSYFPCCAVEWVQQLKRLELELGDDLQDLERVLHFAFEADFGLALRANDGFRNGYASCYASESEINRDAFHQVVQQEWERVLSGVYGLILRVPVEAGNVVRKVCLENQIARLSQSKEKLSVNRGRVRSLLKEYNNMIHLQFYEGDTVVFAPDLFANF